MDLEGRLAQIAERARVAQPRLASMLPEKISLSGASETDRYFLALCADVAETQEYSRENALRLVKAAKVVLAKRTDNGRLVKESVGWIFKKNCYSVAVDCLDKIEAAAYSGKEVRPSDLKDIRKLVEKVNNPPLVAYLKESLEIAIDRLTPKTNVFQELTLAYAIKNPVFLIKGKKAPKITDVSYILLTFIIIISLNSVAHFTIPVLLIIAIFVNLMLRELRELLYPPSPKITPLELDAARLYADIEEIVRTKAPTKYNEIPTLLDRFINVCENMKDKKEGHRYLQSFYKNCFSTLRLIDIGLDKETAKTKFDGWENKFKSSE